MYAQIENKNKKIGNIKRKKSKTSVASKYRKFQENYKEVYILASGRQKTLQTNLKTDSFKLSRMRRTKK